jgi:hypothetical protein
MNTNEETPSTPRGESTHEAKRSVERSEHTSGTWRIENEDETGSMVGTNGKTIATVWRSPANARLIAAAPELLAALQEIAFLDQRDGRFAEIARTAILRATEGDK